MTNDSTPLRPLVIGIAGGSGSGKTTVARRIAEALAPVHVARVDMDAYYRHRPDLTLDQRKQLNWDHPDTIEHDLFLAQLDALRNGEGVAKPVYDYALHLRMPEAERVAASPVVIVDGILLLVDQRVRERCDVKVFVDADADERLIRRLRRDVAERGRPLDEIVRQYLDSVKPMHLQFVEPSKRYADVIIPRGGENLVAINLVIAMVRARLEGSR